MPERLIGPGHPAELCVRMPRMLWRSARRGRRRAYMMVTKLIYNVEESYDAIILVLKIETY